MTKATTIVLALATVIVPSVQLRAQPKCTEICRGTGKFAGASGNLNVSGPYILWLSDSIFGVDGRFNGVFSGSVCGVQ
jgi:hypothetical protein